MRDTAKGRIERLQPYHRHGRRQQNVLWILDDLSRTDRHTALPLRISISAGASAASDKNDQGTTYVSFARFGKLTDVAVADGLWLLWHATRGIYASFAVELTCPRDLRIDRPKEALASPVAQLAEPADLDGPRNDVASNFLTNVEQDHTTGP